MADGVTIRVLKNDLPRIVAGMEAKADRIVAKAAADIAAQAITRAPVDTGYLRASIRAVRVGQAHWRVVVGAEYGIYQEYGTRYHAAQPFLRPAVEAVRPAFIQALQGVVR